MTKPRPPAALAAYGAAARYPDGLHLSTHMDVDQAHRHCGNHRAELEASLACGCFYCLETYAPSTIAEWIDSGATALCPRCGIDAVIGSASGVALTDEFLVRMKARWFEV